MMNGTESLAKNFTMIENSMDKMWDMWLVSLGSLSWTQDQMENMARKQLDRNKSAREEIIKLVEDQNKQMRRNQEQLQKVVQESVMNTYTQMNFSNEKVMGEFSNRLIEMATKPAAQ